VTGYNDGPEGDPAPGLWGESEHSEGVHGVSHGQGGREGYNDGEPGAAAPGLWGESESADGVVGISHFPLRSGIVGRNASSGGGLAGTFHGSVVITGEATVNGLISLAADRGTGGTVRLFSRVPILGPLQGDYAALDRRSYP
jgi:hypothetical protein